ncbi:uncharacterized protein LOC144551803 [Carex rostrata]
MGEHVHSLEIKLRELEKLNDKLSLIENELQQSELQYLGVMHELEYKEEESQKSALQVQKLEVVYLDSQCEIESLKLDLNELEQRLFESRESIRQLEAENKELHLYMLETIRFFSTVEAQLENLLEKMRVHLGGEIDQVMLLERGGVWEFLLRLHAEELQDEKRRANEDAEDLTQEMAELQYQITGMLDEECKHRALIEDQVMKEHKRLHSEANPC